MESVRCGDELRRDAHFVAGAANRSFDNVCDAVRAAAISGIGTLALLK
jgi:hypothetical protein